MIHLIKTARWRRSVRSTWTSADDHPYADHQKGYWPLRIRTTLRRPPKTSSGPVTAVLLSHQRALNLDLQVRLCLQTPSIGAVVVSNNNEAVSLADVVRVRSPRLTLRDDFGLNQVRRYLIAGELDADAYVFLDDDVFLEPRDIERLCQDFLADQASPLGVMGQLLDHDAHWHSGVIDDGAQVDVLNRLYLVSREHAQRVFEVAQHLGWSKEVAATMPADDVLVSFSGTASARIRAVPFIDCVSHNHRKISTFRQPGFHDARADWVSTLKQCTGLDAAATAREEHLR